MKKLVLTEKPSVAREIAKVLGCHQNQNGSLVGSQYIITWALGHLVTLAAPEEMNRAWQVWQLDTLPMIPKKFETTVIKQTAKQFQCVKALLKSPEISELIIATDAGREGELVARWIIDKVGFTKPMKRLWISSMTDQAIRDGFAHLKDAKEYKRLYDSAEARAIADWLVGLNVTRALTCKYNAQLSSGRVQTPTLAMIVDREEEIRKFIPKDFEQLYLRSKQVDFCYYSENGESRLFQHQEAEMLKKLCESAVMTVKDIVTTPKKELPPLLYDLTSLQQDANRLYGYSAKMTLDIVQKLYEVDKYLTYPRTDSKYLSDDMYVTVKDRIYNLNGYPYQTFVKEILSQTISHSKRIFDNSKVSDHHAIIPTELKANVMGLSLSEKNIYDLVTKRFLSVFLPEYQYAQTQIFLEAKTNTKTMVFKASGKVVEKVGWKAIYQKNELVEEENEMALPVFSQGEKIIHPTVFLKSGKTKAPDRYTEATLLYAMEHAGKFVESKKMKEVLEQTSGIGTPATRADIIERIFSANYVELKGKTIFPTEKGMQLVNLVPSPLKSPQLTAEWEMRLTRISEGKEDKNTFISDMEKNAVTLTMAVIEQSQMYRHDNMTAQRCPQCGKPLLEVDNQFGKSLCCMDRGCNFRKVISKKTNLRCPACHKKLAKIGSEEKAFYQCACGFKEKVTTFHDKLKEGHQGMKKQDVNQYLRSQKNDIPVNNPFMELWDKDK